MIFNHLFYLFIACFDSTTWIVVAMKARRGHRRAYHRGTGNHELLDKCLVKIDIAFFLKKGASP